jgi:hypothetical protein
LLLDTVVIENPEKEKDNIRPEKNYLKKNKHTICRIRPELSGRASAFCHSIFGVGYPEEN